MEIGLYQTGLFSLLSCHPLLTNKKLTGFKQTSLKKWNVAFFKTLKMQVNKNKITALTDQEDKYERSNYYGMFGINRKRSDKVLSRNGL
jgi:hypothetical protein